MDGSGGNRLQEVYLGVRCLELRDRDLGGDVIRREALLGHEQPRCESLRERELSQKVNRAMFLKAGDVQGFCLILKMCKNYLTLIDIIVYK